MLTEEEKKTFIQDKLEARIGELEENKKEEEIVMEEAPKTLNQLMKSGIPKRKKRHTAYKKNKKKKSKSN